jgi:hypothetical protein
MKITYFEPPPFFVAANSIKYENVNNDNKLQKMVTEKFLNKTIRWLEDDNSFNKSKKYLSKIKGPDGYDIIYRLLKLFVKKGNTNWYDLSPQSSLVKDYIRYKLKHL